MRSRCERLEAGILRCPLMMVRRLQQFVFCLHFVWVISPGTVLNYRHEIVVLSGGLIRSGGKAQTYTFSDAVACGLLERYRQAASVHCIAACQGPRGHSAPLLRICGRTPLASGP